MELTIEQKDYLSRMGYLQYDYKQIEKAASLCKYYTCVGNKECRISREETIEKIGRNDWISGVARAAFHYTAMRDDVLFVCKLF